MGKTNIVSVRWFDGYFEEFECSEVRFGAYILWMRLTTGKERIIPLTQVRWFSQSIESHQNANVYEEADNNYVSFLEAQEYMKNGGILYTDENNEVFYEKSNFFKRVNGKKVPLKTLELTCLHVTEKE